MRIDHWGLDQVMQLPDHCFGRRWVVSCEIHGASGTTAWDMSEVGFPDVGVIWELVVEPFYCTFAGDYIRLALGDQLPAAAAMMDGLEPLIAGLGETGAEPRHMYVFYNLGSSLIQMREPKRFQGRRLVMEVAPSVEKFMWVRVMVVVSSIPKEVPDWLISG